MLRKQISVKILLAVCGILLGSIFIWAQKPQFEKKYYNGTAYLSDKVTKSGTIKVADFLRLVDQPLAVKDHRDGSFNEALIFVFTYAERGLYEDETGKPMIVTDYLSTNCKGTVDTTTMFELKNPSSS
jgi:hypothetical protein